MVFLRKLNFRATSARKRAKAPDALGVLLNEFKAAPIPLSETDWQDLQDRLMRPQKAQSSRKQAKRREAKIAFAVCAGLLLVAAPRLMLSLSRNAPPQAPLLAHRASTTAPSSLTTASPLSTPAPPLSTTAPPYSNTVTWGTKTTARNTKIRPQTLTVGRKVRRFRLAARPHFRRFARPVLTGETPLKMALKSNSPNPKPMELAFDSEAESLIFLILPLEDALRNAPTAEADAAPQIDVTAEITAAPTPGTIENKSKEMQPW